MSRLSPLPMRLNSSKNYWNDVQNIRQEEEVKYFSNLYEGQQSFGATRYDAIYINVHVHLFVKMRTKVYDGEEEKQKNQNKNKCMVRFTTVKWSQTTWINLRGRVLAAIFFQTFPIIPFRKRHQKVPYMPYIDSWGPLSTSPSLTKQQQRQKATEWKFLKISILSCLIERHPIASAKKLTVHKVSFLFHTPVSIKTPFV